jgi:hypothetical protein
MGIASWLSVRERQSKLAIKFAVEPPYFLLDILVMPLQGAVQLHNAIERDFRDRL